MRTLIHLYKDEIDAFIKTNSQVFNSPQDQLVMAQSTDSHHSAGGHKKIQRKTIMADIEAALSKSRIAIIKGLPGIGKSQVAKEYAHKSQTAFSRNPRYFEADSEQTFA